MRFTLSLIATLGLFTLSHQKSSEGAKKDTPAQ
jgi:hypothetical protein